MKEADSTDNTKLIETFTQTLPIYTDISIRVGQGCKNDVSLTAPPDIVQALQMNVAIFRPGFIGQVTLSRQ